MNRDIDYCECGEALDFTYGTCPECDDPGTDDEYCNRCAGPVTLDGNCDNDECGIEDDDDDWG